MIQEIRLEFIRRIMYFLVKISKGGKFTEKLETAYKNTLIATFIITLFLLGTLAKFWQLNIYSNDADYLYQVLLKKERHANSELERNVIFARDQLALTQELVEENKKLRKAINELEEENRQLKAEKKGSK